MNALKYLVIGMGVLIVAGFAVVIVTLASRMGDSQGFGTVALPVPAHCTIAQSDPDRGRVVVRFTGGAECETILVVDQDSGALLGRLELGGAAVDAE